MPQIAHDLKYVMSQGSLREGLNHSPRFKIQDMFWCQVSLYFAICLFELNFYL